METNMNIQNENNEQLNSQNKPKESNIERERFITLIATQVEFLKKVRSAGKGVYMKNRDELLQQLRHNLWYAYMNRTLTYPMYQELLEIVREAFSHDNLIGVEQLSIFDYLPDEPFEAKKEEKETDNPENYK